MTKTFAWCLNCGQSVDLGPELNKRPPPHYQCVYCDAPAARAIPAERHIVPAVIDGHPVRYTPLVLTNPPK